MAKKDSFSERARQHIEQQQKIAEAERTKKLKEKRMELVNNGVRAYKAMRMGEAVANYQAFLKVVEEWKGVPSGGLQPSQFDKQKELSELLLISGVYWDLVRLYDRTKSAERKKDFLRFMEKYVAFSRGMPFQAVCSEGLRKYLAHEDPKHKKEFKNAYKMLAPDATKCFVATSLMDVTEEESLTTLRLFRDEVLKKSHGGRAFVAWYYRNGPKIAERVDRFPQIIRKLMGLGLNCLARSITAVRCRSGLAGK